MFRFLSTAQCFIASAGRTSLCAMSSIDPPLSDHDLAQRMIEHKLICQGEDEQQALEQFIKSIGYYRLEEYTWPYRLILNSKQNKRSSQFKKQITFKKIKNTYLFDRRLRILLMDAMERFEIALKNRITQVLTQASASSTPHANDTLFINADKLKKWRDGLQKTYMASQEARIIHCINHHGIVHVSDLPLWILMSLSTFGEVKKLYELMTVQLKNNLADDLGVSRDFLTASIMLFHKVRNKCAHHSRIWNVSWVRTAKKKDAQNSTPIFGAIFQDNRWFYVWEEGSCQWGLPTEGKKKLAFNPKNTAFVFILAGLWLDKIAQTSQWKARVISTLEPKGKLLHNAREAGFISHWAKHPLWDTSLHRVPV